MFQQPVHLTSSLVGTDDLASSARQRVEETLRDNAARPLFTGIAVSIHLNVLA